ncbi:Rrf2 family transcriptional regulator [Herbaspirillum sp. GCM10030257]|uniref:Rrf2 family transcriptional regulator n=1 Tax=Herbaspirillum sp. GCM10030257 TaxID=3273393 RepID=UPI003613E52C
MMVTVEDCILGNSELHDRFFAVTEVLARLVSSAPRSVSIAQIEEETSRPEKEITKLCTALARDGLLRPDPHAPERWMLACEASLVTLEDVFRCVLATQQTRCRPGGRNTADRVPNDVDLLVMQAMIAINQSVFTHLRQFSLDRLKISAAGMFPAPRSGTQSHFANKAFDVAFT